MQMTNRRSSSAKFFDHSLAGAPVSARPRNTRTTPKRCGKLQGDAGLFRFGDGSQRGLARFKSRRSHEDDRVLDVLTLEPRQRLQILRQDA